jgi:hypothetical protein
VAIPQFDAREELLKMGMPTSDPAEKKQWQQSLQFREGLQLCLGVTTVRYIFCIRCPTSAQITKSLVETFTRINHDAPRDVHVHVFCSAFGFNFLPVDELCVSDRVDTAIATIKNENGDLLRTIPTFPGRFN